MIQTFYYLYDKNAQCVRLTGTFRTDTDALVSFLSRLPSFSATVNTCEVRALASFDDEEISLKPLEKSRSVPWSTLDFDLLPSSLIDNLKLYGSIPSDDKRVTIEWLDKRISDIESLLKNYSETK